MLSFATPHPSSLAYILLCAGPVVAVVRCKAHPLGVRMARRNTCAIIIPGGAKVLGHPLLLTYDNGSVYVAVNIGKSLAIGDGALTGLEAHRVTICRTLTVGGAGPHVVGGFGHQPPQMAYKYTDTGTIHSKPQVVL